jgi:hypothetical protein
MSDNDELLARVRSRLFNGPAEYEELEPEDQKEKTYRIAKMIARDGDLKLLRKILTDLRSLTSLLSHHGQSMCAEIISATNQLK